jgi:hypothetical protein
MHVFYLDVAYVYNGFKCFSCVFRSVSDACFKCFVIFRRMLQLLHMDVSKLDRVLHLPPRLFYCLGSVSDAGRQRWAPCACGRVQQARHGQAGVRQGASIRTFKC